MDAPSLDVPASTPLPLPPRRFNWLRVKTTGVLLLRYAWLPAILIAFGIYGGRLVKGYRNQANPDGISYLTIARQYLDGHWFDAINAYWSPLYSWLLVPLMACGIEPLLATKILAVIIGGGALAAVWWIGRNLRWGIESRLLICITLMPILFYFGMTVTTPDLLMCCMLLVYLGQMTQPRFHKHGWKSAAAAGALGGVAYLAKAYAMPVVVGHLLATSTLAMCRSGSWRVRRRMLAQLAIALCVMGVIVAAWGMTLRHKYGRFTTGSTGTFNIAWNGPTFKSPMHVEGLLPLPNETGTSAWDDATVLPYPAWNPIATRADRLHWEKNRSRNEQELIAAGRRFTWLLWPILFAGIWLSATSLDRRPRRAGGYIVAAVLIFPLGYYLLHVEFRFLSFICVGLLLIGAFVVHALTRPLNRWVRVPLRFVAMAGVCWSFLSNPAWDPAKDPWQKSFARWSVASRWGAHADQEQAALQLAGLMPPRAKVASIGHWGETLDLSFRLNLRYLGELHARQTPAQVSAALKKFDVEYLWIRGGVERYPFLKNRPDLLGGRAGNLRVYHVRDEVPAATRPALPATQPATRPK